MLFVGSIKKRWQCHCVPLISEAGQVTNGIGQDPHKYYRKFSQIQSLLTYLLVYPDYRIFIESCVSTICYFFN